MPIKRPQRSRVTLTFCGFGCPVKFADRRLARFSEVRLRTLIFIAKLALQHFDNFGSERENHADATANAIFRMIICISPLR